MRPLIGITTYAVDPGGRITLPHEYVAAVRRAGGLPVLVPPGDDDPAEVLERLDGLILAGGGDVDPSRYGADAAHDTVYGTDSARDAAELALVKHVLAERLPTFAICRGLQVVNVALGGTLHQHVPDVVGEQVAHRAPPREPTPHSVTLDDDATLTEIMGTAEVSTMSWHHQAIDRLADGFVVVARAPDGVIEAIAHPDHGELVAVQWHPELTAGDDPTQQALFDHLVARAAAGAGR